MLTITGFIEIARNYLLWHRNCLSNLALGRPINRRRRHQFLRRSMICLNRPALIIFASVVFAGAVEAGTNVYVDPDWAGTKSGTQIAPFATLDSSAWSTISPALASGDAGNGVPLPIDLTRKGTSTAFHLTFDGKSFYNASDSTPSWSASTITRLSVVLKVTK